MPEALVLAVVRSYSAGPPRTAAVRLVGGLETLLGAIPVAAHVDAADLTVGRECVVAFTEPTDYRSAVVVGVVGTPAGGGGGGIDPTRYGLTDRPQLILPDSTTPSLVACGAGANVYGNWVQLTAGLGSNIWVLTVMLHMQQGIRAVEVEVGVGVAGSEVVWWSGAIYAGQSFGQEFQVWPVWFSFRVPASTRVAVHARSSGGGGGTQVWVGYKVE